MSTYLHIDLLPVESPKRFICSICCYEEGEELLSYPSGTTGVMIYDGNNPELTEIPVLNSRWPTLRSLQIECTRGSKHRRGLGYNRISSSQRSHLLLINRGQKVEFSLTSDFTIILNIPFIDNKNGIFFVTGFLTYFIIWCHFLV